jgi:hypothetical protein
MGPSDSTKGKAADASHSKPAAFQTSFENTHEVPRQFAIEADPLEGLRRGLAGLGLGCVQLTGSELALTGPGSPGRALPDVRSAWVYLRRLRGLA